MRSRHGFTLLEVIVALGIFAVGATAAFALLVAGAAAGRRAEHEIQAALIAESVISDLRADLDLDLELRDYPRASDLTPGADPETRYLVQGEKLASYPDYEFDVALTPLPGPVASQPWEYLVEVEVRWQEKGQGRSKQLATVLVRGLSHLDNPQPRR